MDLVEHRRLLNRKGSDADMGRWETILDYTVSEELSATDTYHEVMNVDATFFSKDTGCKENYFC